ncbi:AraC family transcriptional regulator [Pelagicoccus mobilis]|uniref:DNA-binding transcriptional regulator n=1 Tax=Pelagicoccus mobilis TaxID=415221 RepID=A0A934VJS1_9BACT|nr:DNA-binding transcriptional regulator [Pelagicoccus mobilis]MBK1875916.1 DNA-binding transcriptional regulator [Pelagicoccus mobilis]
MTNSHATPPKVALLLQGVRHYEREMLSGIANYANLHGPWQFYRNVSYLSEEKITPTKLIDSWQPDAMIIRESTPHYYDEILTRRIPIIYSPTTEPRPDVSNIIVDDEAVGALAAQHLYENGFRNFAFCGINTLFFWSRRRCQGFCDKAHAYGQAAHVFDSPQGEEFLSWNKGFSKLKDWLAALPAHTGIMVCTDDFALLVQEACIAIGRSVPDEIAIIGVGNDESVCELATTPLSSVELNIKRAGYDAAKHIADRLKQTPPPPTDIIIPPLGIAARRSTDAKETQDPVVSKAISYILKRINHPIEVSDIVDQVHLSRRTLYDRFQRATGQTISNYIRNRRLEHFSKLLLETNLTVSEISYTMGYESDTNVARLFKKHYGLTPLAYRRKHAS